MCHLSRQTQAKATACRSSTTRAVCRSGPATSPAESSRGDASASSSTRGSCWGCPEPRCPRRSNFKPAEVGDLINYIQSLSDASTPAKVEHRRDAAHRHAGERNPARGDWRYAMGQSRQPRRSSSARSGGEITGIPTCMYRPCTTARRWPSASPGAMRPATPRRSGPRISPTWPPCSYSRGSTSPSSAWGRRTDRWMSGSGTRAAQADQEQYADVDTAYPNMAVDQYPFEEPGDGPGTIPRSASPGNSSPPGRPAIRGPTRAMSFLAATSRPRDLAA